MLDEPRSPATAYICIPWQGHIVLGTVWMNRTPNAINAHTKVDNNNNKKWYKKNTVKNEGIFDITVKTTCNVLLAVLQIAQIKLWEKKVQDGGRGGHLGCRTTPQNTMFCPLHPTNAHAKFETKASIIVTCIALTRKCHWRGGGGGTDPKLLYYS